MQYIMFALLNILYNYSLFSLYMETHMENDVLLLKEAYMYRSCS